MAIITLRKLYDIYSNALQVNVMTSFQNTNGLAQFQFSPVMKDFYGKTSGYDSNDKQPRYDYSNENQFYLPIYNLSQLLLYGRSYVAADEFTVANIPEEFRNEDFSMNISMKTSMYVGSLRDLSSGVFSDEIVNMMFANDIEEDLVQSNDMLVMLFVTKLNDREIDYKRHFISKDSFVNQFLHVLKAIENIINSYQIPLLRSVVADVVYASKKNSSSTQSNSTYGQQQRPANATSRFSSKPSNMAAPRSNTLTSSNAASPSQQATTTNKQPPLKYNNGRVGTAKTSNAAVETLVANFDFDDNDDSDD